MQNLRVSTQFNRGVENIISDLAVFNSYEQFHTNEKLIGIYEVLDTNKVKIKELGKDIIQKIRCMERLYQVPERENVLEENVFEYYPGNQLARLF
ncbi:unnamed protein product [Brachionus calyciflorus]|uniref:Uncharacterized protein n=1 Tax=Brachionus calyciflorus TaxID=104777 RepID=A0A814J7I5_9BILA|nr:unnamed protein product [Brachionus calyciflorus]